MKKRIISLLLSLAIMATFIFPMNVFADEETTRTYTRNGYEITYDIKGSWVGNQNVEVTIRNTGTESLLNWALKYDAHGEINGLWNGTVFSSDSTKYIVKNAGYNYEIQPEQSVTFGYTLSGEYMEFPEAIELCSQRTERSAEGYSVTMDVTDDWDTGFTGTVTIKNLGESSLEAWRLSFDTNFVIEDIWNAQILSSFENSYTVANDITTTPIGVGESKIFGFKAAKEPGVTPEMTNFVMSEITVNEDFTTIDVPEINLAVSGFANYLEEENALNIFWYTTIENGRFELLESYNNEDFITTVILNNEYSYTYPITMDFDKRYFKVIQTTDDGQTAESPVFYVEKTDNGYSAKFIDSDGDGLPNFAEEQIGTDINNADTDSDGLTDYQEYYILGTDPLVYDSVTEGVSDADADCDSDGLSNIREFELGTKPFNPDTDNDGLTDGDEVNIYGTDPLKYDTDDDEISDGDEITLGTDPLSPTTDGISDTERTFVQTIEADDEILEDINTEYNPYDLSLEITAAGNAHSSLTVQESGYSDSMFNWSILGVCPELIYDNACKVDEVVLKFKVDEEYIDNPDSEYAKENPEFVGIKRYNVFRFFEEDNILLPVKTDVDVENSTVSATVSDLGTYCLVDMECFLQDIVQGAKDFNSEETGTEELPTLQTFSLYAVNALSTAAENTETEPDKKVKPAIKYSDEFNVVIMYDNRDCFSNTDYRIFYDFICKTAEFIFSKSPNAHIYLIKMGSTSSDDTFIATSAIHDLSVFKDNLEEKTKSVDLSDETIEELLKKDPNYETMTEEDKESWRKSKRDANSLTNNVVVSDPFDYVVNGVSNDKESSYTKVIDTSVPTLCFSFFNDKNALYEKSTGYKYLEQLIEQNVFVSLIGDYDFSTYIGGYAYDLYQQTGGKQFSLRGSTSLYQRLINYIYDKSDSDEYPEIIHKYPMILSTGLEYVDLDAPITVDYIDAYKSVKNYGRDSIKTSKYADTDDDGLCDFEEINFDSDLIKVEDGRIVIPTYEDCVNKFGDEYFYVEEGLDRFFESAPDYLPTADAYRVLYNTKVLPIRSDPTYKDSDYDGYYDAEELLRNNTNPIKEEILLDKYKYDYLVDEKYHYNAEGFRNLYDNNLDLQLMIFSNNAIFSQNIDYTLMYEQVLLDYINYMYNFENGLDINDYYKMVLKCTKTSRSFVKNVKRASDVYDSMVSKRVMSIYLDMLDHKALLSRMRTSARLYDSSVVNGLIEKYTKLADDMYVESCNLSNTQLNFLDDIDRTLLDDLNTYFYIGTELFDLGMDMQQRLTFSTTIMDYAEEFEQYSDLLYIIRNECCDPYLYDAASKLIEELDNARNGMGKSIMDISKEMFSSPSTYFKIGDVVLAFFPLGQGIIGIRDAINSILNISEQSQNAVRTEAMATISNVIADNIRLNYRFSYVTSSFCCVDDDSIIEKIYRLNESRSFGEETYLTLKESNPFWWTLITDMDNKAIEESYSVISYLSILQCEGYLKNEE